VAIALASRRKKASAAGSSAMARGDHLDRLAALEDAVLGEIDDDSHSSLAQLAQDPITLDRKGPGSGGN